MRISPSIASSNLLNIEEELKRIGNDFDTLHIDIEDGNFVPNITFGFNLLNQLSKVTMKPFSIHLMVMQPELYISKLARFNCEIIFVHVESTRYFRNIIQLVKGHGIKVGMALNPSTNMDGYMYLIDEVDAILLMTSEEDQLGNQFNHQLLPKIMKCSDTVSKELWCDGGIGPPQIALLKDCGVSVCVMGRALFNDEQPRLLIEKYQK